MISTILAAPGVIIMAGIGLVVGVLLLADLIRDAFASDYDYVQIDRGEIIERGDHRVTLAENIARTARDTCGRGHPKTPEHGRIRSGMKWRCRTCETLTQRERRAVTR